MSNQQAPQPGTGYPPQQPASQQAYPAYVAPPPAGYPTMDGTAGAYPPAAGGGDTKSRGHHHHHHHSGGGFWRGCCAALCCCCLLDMCF